MEALAHMPSKISVRLCFQPGIEDIPFSPLLVLFRGVDVRIGFFYFKTRSVSTEKANPGTRPKESLQTLAKGSTIRAMAKPKHITSLEKLLNKAKQDPEVLSVILFGSQACGEATAASDVDVCLVLLNQRYDSLYLSRTKLEYLKMDGLDIHIYQQLPLYIRRRVIKEGKVLFVRDEELLYELAFRTAQAFEDFRHLYYDYLEEVARVGS